MAQEDKLIKCFSQSIADATPHRIFTQSASNATQKVSLRDNYIKLMDVASEQENPPKFAHEIFSRIGQELVDNYLKTQKLNQTEEKKEKKPFWVVYKQQGFLYQPETKNNYAIGRYPGCFPQLEANEFRASRIGALIFFVDNYIILVDVGSLNGIKTLERSSKKKPEETDEFVRVLVFDAEEKFVVKLGQEIVGFNVQVCVVCQENPRTITLTCSHQVLCSECYKKIFNEGDQKCPICRAPLSEKQFPEKLNICLQSCVKV